MLRQPEHASGWAIGGTWRAVMLAPVWAGLFRILLLQHATWSVNSCATCSATAGHVLARGRADTPVQEQIASLLAR